MDKELLKVVTEILGPTQEKFANVVCNVISTYVNPKLIINDRPFIIAAVNMVLTKNSRQERKLSARFDEKVVLEKRAISSRRVNKKISNR